MPSKIGSQEMYAMLYTGGKALEQQVSEIDALNVFPVPDGDTGTNMNLSFQSGIQEMESNHSETDTLGSTMGSFARGIMMGARGNSGVILSQLFRGMSQALKGKEVATSEDFALALDKGVEIAYKAVMKPVEGTILTVARESAKAAVRASKRNPSIDEVFKAAIDQAELTLEQTPDMLPVLKEVGVVDAGGKGLIVIYKGMYQALTGEQLTFERKATKQQSTSHEVVASEEFGYCTEFIIQNLTEPVNETFLRSTLSDMGDSLLVVHDEDFVKIHIHTLDPGQVLSHCLQIGSLHRIKIDNMTEQHEHTQANKETSAVVKQSNYSQAHDGQLKPYGIVSVTNGEGIKDIFMSLGANEVVFGGQSMNPSTEDLANAVRKINAETVIILPNNKNIILAAEQVASVVEDKQIIVIPTKTIPEGIAAILSFHEEQDIEDNIDVMKDAAKSVVSGQVTYAIRDTQINGATIKEGDILGILGSEIVVNGTNLVQTTVDLLENMVDKDEHEIITIFTGEEVKQPEIAELQEIIEAKYDDFDIEIKSGLQPTYYFIISVE
ncbi:DAK2 domain-containing protein [Desulfuribacillus alkaliarsenatis]|uniref:DhaL domain-containing protein n=1 Tax=Desulfuribacillus alkaliarsenatis TaxID=766136 RepID=A0A1E5G719_9FIRM|nr:DAK2 domain-containing protein [Desulfuribacillus alkaliarsenatis]OEF98544.1 hypothetical protein BHF68_02450 [Desulfuribacillus alkaliarsenatis]